MSTTDTVALPPIGLGTYRNDDFDECAETVETALEVGYHHVDTAEAYGNEEAVGAGIERSGVPRDDVFLATKVLHPKFTDDYSTENIVENGRACLSRLGVDAVDLFYGVHWPGGDYDPEDTFEACAQLADEGAYDYLGVCNMTPALLDEAQNISSVSIEVLQVEMHPLLQQAELREYCDRHDISLVAYAPLGNGRVFDVPELSSVAEKHDTSTAQVSLAWLRDKGAHPIPKATGRDHLTENLAAERLELDDDDIAMIDGISREDRQYDNPYAPDW